MTNPSIHPCPKCGNMPELINGAFGTCFGCKKCDIAAPRRDRWELLVRDVLGRACRELGIETVEQLKAKTKPDPRVAVLDNLINQAKSISSSARYAAPEMQHIIFERAMGLVTQLIAAQRGEE